MIEMIIFGLTEVDFRYIRFSLPEFYRDNIAKQCFRRFDRAMAQLDLLGELCQTDPVNGLM